MYYNQCMPRLTVRRTGNSLSLALPRGLVRELGVAPGDQVLATVQRIPRLASLSGRMRGRLTPEEFTRMSNEGEDLG